VQSLTTLWKGIGSTLMVKGVTVASETAIHEFTPLPRFETSFHLQLIFAVLLHRTDKQVKNSFPLLIRKIELKQWSAIILVCC